VGVETEVDLRHATWRKSSRSGPNCDNCVEIAFVTPAIAIRDSKDPDGPALILAPGGWSAFLSGTKTGEFIPTTDLR
jgi:hypothetical protein